MSYFPRGYFTPVFFGLYFGAVAAPAPAPAPAPPVSIGGLASPRWSHSHLGRVHAGRARFSVASSLRATGQRIRPAPHFAAPPRPWHAEATFHAVGILASRHREASAVPWRVGAAWSAMGAAIRTGAANFQVRTSFTVRGTAVASPRWTAAQDEADIEEILLLASML